MAASPPHVLPVIYGYVRQTGRIAISLKRHSTRDKQFFKNSSSFSNLSMSILRGQVSVACVFVQFFRRKEVLYKIDGEPLT